MEDMLKVLKKGREKKIFNDKEEFIKLLKQMQSADESLELDWDDGAGEEWAIFYTSKNGTVCMMNVKIGVAFFRKSYDINILNGIIDDLQIVYTEDYCTEQWYINFDELKSSIPEIYWHSAEEVVNRNSFSLDDLYFATI